MSVQILRSEPRPNGVYAVTLFDDNVRLVAIVDAAIMASKDRDRTLQFMVDSERERLVKARRATLPEVAP